MTNVPEIPLEKIDNYRWRLPKSYKPGMRVPGIIYADEKLLKDIRQDKALEQVANVAFLPGIVKASLAMPDTHWGYGFCIGGVAATDIEEEGVISPGGVGFDINCLASDSKIIMQHGYHLTIEELEKQWKTLQVRCVDFRDSKEEPIAIGRFFKIRPHNTVYRIVTEAGDKILATADHPFWTPDGMLKAGSLKSGSKIAISPFKGPVYEKPADEIILDENSIRSIKPAVNKENIIEQLKMRNLLPLTMDSPYLPFILKIMGYHMGDGTMYITQKKGTVWFYGQPQELELIRKDISQLGFTPSKIYSRVRNHTIATSYDTVEFTQTEYSVKVTATSFLCFLLALGVPMGKKAHQPYLLPDWLLRLKKWQKRLFLAGLFDAELSSPKVYKNGYNFYAPCFSMNKEETLVENGKDFLRQLSLILSEFGIGIQKFGERKEYVNKEGKTTYRLRLLISDNTENLIDFYSSIGFEYNVRKRNEAQIVLQYLKLKKRVLEERERAEEIAYKLYSEGMEAQVIYKGMASTWVNKRFLERCLFEGRNTAPPIAFNFPYFSEYRKQASEGIENSCYVWERIASKEAVDYDDYVYDITVNHPAHNFIANNFVVSNCGVRMLKTNLHIEDVRDKIKDLVAVLFSTVPAGVGSEGDIRVSQREEKDILLKGAAWAVEKGYGVPGDLECTEEYGAIQGADPAAVSERAFERGKKQSGTLGSGNHFLEVQVIDQLYDRDVCDTLGFDLGQITVMIHSGSRGLGYQICDDYTKSMLRCLEKYRINVPDRQLACAPVKSPEGQAYLAAMRCAANYAWANRQCLMHLTRKAFEKVFSMSWQKMGMSLIYDVCHNIAKIEKHTIEGREKTVCVHRKGATRAFAPGHPALPERYKKTGQPVIIPGDMGRNSYLLVGTSKAMEETFGSTCHGAGRLKSRTAAARSIDAGQLVKELSGKGITVMASGRGTLVEEAPQVYKDVNDVVDVVHNAGISKRVCRMRPLGVIKG